MRTIFIDPSQGLVEEWEWDEDFISVYAKLECEWCEEVLIENDGYAILCDEEYLSQPRNNRAFFMLAFYPRPIGGKALLVRISGIDYEGVKMDLDKVRRGVFFQALKGDLQ